MPPAARRLFATFLVVTATGAGTWGGEPAAEPSPPQPPPKRYPVRVAGRLFQLEIAATPKAQSRGLMGRTKLAANGGMLFAFPDERRRRFWMARTLLDLDILFLNGSGQVVALHRMRAEPPRDAGETEAEYAARLPLYASVDPARYAIEFRAGTIDTMPTCRLGSICLEPAQIRHIEVVARAQRKRRQQP